MAERTSLIEALRQEADLSEKGIDFMDDEDLANETRVQIGMLRDAAAEIERLTTTLQEIAEFVDYPGRPVLALMARDALRG